MNHWAVIPSRNRIDSLVNLCRQLEDDGVSVVVVDNGYDEEALKKLPGNTYIQHWEEDPPNISRLWNKGLAWVDEMNSDSEYIVAVLNDDIIVPPKFVQQLGIFILSQDAVAAYPDQHDYFLGKGNCLTHRTATPVSIFTRLCGYAFALRGSAGLRADETLAWWYGDDDLGWRAAAAGGAVLVGGLKVQHLSPNSTTVGKLAEQAGIDRQTFIDKWGMAPW